MRRLLSIVVVFALSGCGLVLQKEARDQMLVSKAKYKNCLEKNPSSPSPCSGLKAAYKADMEALQQVSPDFSTKYDVNIEHDKD